MRLLPPWITKLSIVYHCMLCTACELRDFSFIFIDQNYKKKKKLILDTVLPKCLPGTRLSLNIQPGSRGWMCSCCGYTPTPDAKNIHANTHRNTEQVMMAKTISRHPICQASWQPSPSCIKINRIIHLCTELQAPCHFRHLEMRLWALRDKDSKYEQHIYMNLG